jgi:septal ring factor EnvC (AmiA/AmiB activator)
MSKRLIAGIFIAVLIVAASGAVAFAFNASSKRSDALSELVSANENLHTSKSEITELTRQLEAFDQEKSALAEQVASQGAKLSEAQGKLNDATAQLTNALSKIEDLETAKKALESRLSKMNGTTSIMTRKIDFYECEDSLDMDYSSVLAASSRLTAYVDGLSFVDHASTSYRDTVWNNTDTKIYGIRYVHEDKETYSMLFLVYCNELGWKKGVFYIDGQCWLDVPVK